MTTEATTDRRSPAAAVAALVRVPNLFTAPPDVLLGAALAVGAGGEVAPATVAGLAVASVLLYAAGTTLNDAFDAPVDARERPERPVPAGDISRRAAFGLGGALLLAGVVAAGAASGLAGAAVAALLAATILLYDGALKGGPVGFLAMGASRGLDVLLGTTPGTGTPPARWLFPAVVVAVYVAAVTFMAARETEGENRPAVALAAAGAVVAALGVGVHVALARPPLAAVATAVVLAAAFLGWTGRALRAAYVDPVPENVGPAVAACVLGIVVLDAAFAAATGVIWGVAAAAFLVPAVGLARAFEVT